MNDVSMGSVMLSLFFLLSVQSFLFIAYLASKRHLSKDRLLRFIAILGMGILASLLPMGFISVFFGFPAIFVFSVAISLFLDKDTPVQTGKPTDLPVQRALYMRAVDHSIILERENFRFRQALEDIAAQPTVQEYEENSESEEFDGDMEYGYEQMIYVARNTLKGKV